MKNLLSAFRSLFKKGQNNLIKIVCLGVGLAMGLVLFSKVFFEFTYDDFYPDKERIYMIKSSYTQNDITSGPYESVSGGVALGMHNEIPEVEVATRFLNMHYQVFRTPDKKKYGGVVIFADTCFFDVLPRPVIIGDVKDVLSSPMSVMVSEKIARNMGGIDAAVGQIFEVDIAPGKQLVVGGVFKDVPENTHARYDVIVSLVSISRFMWDGTENWDGNDMYRGYVKLYPDVDPASLTESIRAMQGRHQSLEEMHRRGVDMQYTLHELTELHSSSPSVKREALLLGLLGGVLLFTAILNYILIVLSSLIARTKEVAVYKTYGASAKEILRKMMTETGVHLLISIALSVFIIFLFREKIEEILKVSVWGLFTYRTLLYLAGICLVIFLIAGLTPGILFAKIPVAAAFRSFKETRKNWKLVSLFFQFVASTFLVILLVVIWKQYMFMINSDPGYEYENLVYCHTKGLTMEERLRLQSEIEQLSFVEKVSCSASLPYDPDWGGNSVSEVDGDKVLFTATDLHLADANYLNILNVPLIRGKGFIDGETEQKACLVNQAFEEKMASLAGWDDGVIGKKVRLSYHGTVHIIGVFADFVTNGTVGNVRPAMMFYSNTLDYDAVLMMKLHAISADNMQQLTAHIQKVLPEKELNPYSYKVSVIAMFNDHRLFRDSVMLGGAITLIITLIGLVGYLKDEINRRKSEIAIRKINGGTINDIIRLFIFDITKIILPALCFGVVGAWYISIRWQENFVEKIPLSFLLFFCCSLSVCFIVLTVIVSGSYKTAKDNPVNSLRSE